MQRTMLAAVQATDKQLIAPGYLIQISALLAFSYTKGVLLVSLNTRRHNWSESYLQEALLFTKKRIIACLVSTLRDEFNGNVHRSNVYRPK